jgi:molecular chaperone DnaJ
LPETDHYKVLGIAPTATMADIKKAYRKLANQYHPDKHPEKEYTDDRFRQIVESYALLSDPEKRSRYDLDRLRSGMSGYNEKTILADADEVLRVATGLKIQVEKMDPHSISPGALSAYMILLLSDNHLEMVKTASRPQIRSEIVDALLPLFFYLDAEGMDRVGKRLLLLAGDETQLIHVIKEMTSALLQQKKRTRMTPWLVALSALILCVFMYWYGRSHHG